MLSAMSRYRMAARLRTSRRCYATAKYPIGKELSNFVIDRVEQVPEFNMTAVDLTNKRSGAKHLHIDRADNNKVFGVVFKTNPPDSTGLPHMLEHTTLCGSVKYPVRDPFFKMLNRSLSNFMNAMTGHDYTFFPFATTNNVDYQNLMDVYLDAVFEPLLKPEDFAQEGWRLEHEDPHDKQTPLVFKGVVYNEMKGQVSDPAYYFWIKFQEAIYPSLNNSGGDPRKITNSYYEDLVEFHANHYHPSNSYTYSYGDFPLETTLAKLEDATKTFGKRNRQFAVRQPVDLKDTMQIEIAGPVDPMLPPEKQFKTSVTWFAGKPQDTYEGFLLKVLSTLLIDGHSAPLYQELVESGLGTDYSPNTGMDAMCAVNMFTIGLNGLTEEASSNLDKTIIDSLAKINQFPDARVKAIMHQLELTRKIETSGFGLGLLSALTPGLADNVDPFEQLKWSSIMDRFSKDYEAQGSQLFVDLINKYLVGKPYFKYTMKPDEALPTKLAEEEQMRLATKLEKLTPENKEAIYNEGLELAKSQELKEDLTCLPTLHISDIPREGRYANVREHSLNSTSFQVRTSPKTNGITYLRALKTVSSTDLPRDLIKYLPLYSSCLTNLGTATKTMSELEDEMRLYTGGISASPFVHSSIYQPDKTMLKFGVDSCCLDKNLDKTLSLWTQLLEETNFHNISKLSTLVKSLVSDNLSGIVSSGHSYASNYSQAQLSAVGSLQESLSGIEQVQFLNELGKLEQDNRLEEDVVPKLEQISQILNESRFKFALTCSRDVVREQESLVAKLENAGKEFGQTYDGVKASQGSPETFIEIPSQTNFAAAALKGAEYGSTEGAALQILAQLLTFKYLHREVREKGGAYGGGASYDALNGLFSFYSYRDPKPVQSEETFAKAAKAVKEMISNETITLEDLDQAKLTIFQRIDSPESVREEGMSLFNYEVDQDARQERRENVLDCNLDQVSDACDTLLQRPTVKTIIGSAPGPSQWAALKL